jgi:hypothetical protein
MKKLLIPAILAITLTACSGIIVKGYDLNGKPFEIAANSFGTTQACDGCSFIANKDSRALTIGTVKQDVNVDALKAGAGLIGEIVGDALKAYTGKIGADVAGDVASGLGDLIKDKVKADVADKKAEAAAKALGPAK